MSINACRIVDTAPTRSDFNDHKVWAMILLAVIAWDPGALSIDRVLARFWPASSAAQ